MTKVNKALDPAKMLADQEKMLAKRDETIAALNAKIAEVTRELEASTNASTQMRGIIENQNAVIQGYRTTLADLTLQMVQRPQQ